MLSQVRDTLAPPFTVRKAARALVDRAVRHVAETHGVEIPALERAAARTGKDLRRLTDLLEGARVGDASGVGVILTGSFARYEVTAGSDCDFLVLVQDLPDDPLLVPFLVQETTKLAKELHFKPPGSEGVFGTFSLTSELVARIGLDADSNTNLTRRILLLFESVGVFGPEVRDSAITSLMRRYCHDYRPDVRQKEGPPTTARFLLNDLIRYWRTVTVDFGAKQWRAVRRDWYLRYAKLLTTRKILFAGSMMSMFTVGSATQGLDQSEAYTALVDHLVAETSRTPLARLMSAHDRFSDEGKHALAVILRSYEEFLVLIDDEGARAKLSTAGDARDDAVTAELQSSVEQMGAEIQHALERLFFHERELADQTQKYGLF